MVTKGFNQPRPKICDFMGKLMPATKINHFVKYVTIGLELLYQAVLIKTHCFGYYLPDMFSVIQEVM
jgi:hypothetical protein